jgi:hypothetical protein
MCVPTIKSRRSPAIRFHVVPADNQRVPRAGLTVHANLDTVCIDLHVEVPAVQYRELADKRRGEPSEAVRERVPLRVRC